MQTFEFLRFQSVATGLFLSVGDPRPYLHQTPEYVSQNTVSDNPPHQTWLYNATALLSRASSYAIDIVNADFTKGAKLQQYSPSWKSNQLWLIEPWQSDRKQVILVNAAHPEFAIDIPNGDPNADLQIYTRHDGPNQRWLVHHTLWYAAKIKSAASGGVLDVPAGAQNVGTMIQQFQDGGKLCFNQYWYFGGVLEGYLLQDFLQDEEVSIYSLCNDLVMVPVAPPGLPAGQASKVTLVRIPDARDAWVIHMDTANVAIRTANSLRSIPLALDLPDGDPHNNVPIQVFRDNGGINQRWNIA